VLPSVLRYAVFLVFLASAGVAVAAWAVRTRQLNPFGTPGRTLRKLTDPIVEPVERWLVRNGGNPQNAGWWIFGIALLGGILLLSAAGWLAGQLSLVWAMGGSGSGALKLLVYYAGQLVLLALIVRVIASWFGTFQYSRWMRPAYLLTDWAIQPLRKVVPPIGMIDITPLIAWFAIRFVLSWLMTIL